jgi:hypothetical protein
MSDCEREAVEPRLLDFEIDVARDMDTLSLFMAGCWKGSQVALEGFMEERSSQ